MATIIRWDNRKVIYRSRYFFDDIMRTIKNAVESKIDFSYANLRDTAFYPGIELNGINFSNADFKNARLEYADFKGAILNNVKNLNTNCPKEGEFIGYKKCFIGIKYKRPVIVKLKIPTDAKRSSSTGAKCRCSKAIVLEIQNLDGSISKYKTARSTYNPNFLYKVGCLIEPSKFDDRFWVECAPGIHFFMNRDEAVKY